MKNVATLFFFFLFFVSCVLVEQGEAQSKGVYHLVKPNEDLVAIVDAYMTPRQVIIDVNELKPPYRLRPGDIIFIPDAPRVLDIPARSIAQSKREEPQPARVASAPSAEGTPSPSTTLPTPSPPAAAPTLRGALPLAPPSPSPRMPKGAVTAKQTKPGMKPDKTVTAGIPASSGRGFLMPVAGRIVGKFGKQPNGMFYNGIRIAAAERAKVRASENGLVIYVGELKGYGSTVILQHAQNYATVYTNLASVKVSLDAPVHRGQTLGLAPACGTRNCYISFEMRHHNRAIDPLGRLKEN